MMQTKNNVQISLNYSKCNIFFTDDNIQYLKQVKNVSQISKISNVTIQNILKLRCHFNKDADTVFGWINQLKLYEAQLPILLIYQCGKQSFFILCCQIMNPDTWTLLSLPETI